MHFEGVFSPANQTEYSTEAKNYIGKKLPVQQGWIIEDGPHRGQQCYYAPNTRIGEIPQSDLKELRPVPFARWEQLYSAFECKA